MNKKIKYFTSSKYPTRVYVLSAGLADIISPDNPGEIIVIIDNEPIIPVSMITFDQFKTIANLADKNKIHTQISIAVNTGISQAVISRYFKKNKIKVTNGVTYDDLIVFLFDYSCACNDKNIIDMSLLTSILGIDSSFIYSYFEDNNIDEMEFILLDEAFIIIASLARKGNKNAINWMIAIASKSCNENFNNLLSYN